MTQLSNSDFLSAIQFQRLSNLSNYEKGMKAFPKTVSEYGVEHAMKFYGDKLAVLEFEYQISEKMERVMEKTGSQKETWEVARADVIRALSSSGGGSLFAFAVADARRGAANRWLTVADNALAELAAAH